MEVAPCLREMMEEEVVFAYGPERRIETRRMVVLKNDRWIGAEAIVQRIEFLGIDAVAKWRFPKPWMPKELDEEFRARRTYVEAKALMRALSLGIPVPQLLYVDDRCGLLVESFVEGVLLRDAVPKLGDDELCSICRELGTYLAGLHGAGVVHGDPTTSNVVLSNGVPHLIDFGLAELNATLDDLAIDVHIFFRSVESTHRDRENIMKRCFVEGYRSIAGEERTHLVLLRVERIRRFGRYVSDREVKMEWSF